MPASGVLAPSGISGVASRVPSGQLAGALARVSTPLDFDGAGGVAYRRCIAPPRPPVSRRIRPAPPESHLQDHGQRPPRSGPHRLSSRRRPHAPVRVSLWVRVPEHDLVEIDRLGLQAPVAVDAEARL